MSADTPSHQTDGQSPRCECGCNSCPPIHLERFRHPSPFPLCLSSTSPTGETLTSGGRVVEERSAILRRSPSFLPSPLLHLDLHRRVIATNDASTYVFCKRCSISRRARDKKWIWMKQCLREDREPRSLGETWEENGHELSLHIARWEVTTQRPQAKRSRCAVHA